MRDTSKDRKFFVKMDMHREVVISVMAPDEDCAMDMAASVVDEAVRNVCTFCKSASFQDSATLGEEQPFIELFKARSFRYPQLAKQEVANPDEFKSGHTQEEWDILEEAAKLPSNY